MPTIAELENYPIVDSQLPSDNDVVKLIITIENGIGTGVYASNGYHYEVMVIDYDDQDSEPLERLEPEKELPALRQVWP